MSGAWADLIVWMEFVGFTPQDVVPMLTDELKAREKAALAKARERKFMADQLTLFDDSSWRSA